MISSEDVIPYRDNVQDYVTDVVHAANEVRLNTSGLKDAILGRKVTHQDNETMSAVTREEIDAKLETIEVRMDGRLSSIEAKIDGFVCRIEDRFGRMETDLSESRKEFRSLKTTILTTGIGAVVAIVLGVAAFNAALLSNMLASFESGKNTATALTQATEQLKQTQNELKSLAASLKEQKQPGVPQQAAPHPTK